MAYFEELIFLKKKSATFIISGMPHQEIEPSVQSNSSFHAPSNKTKKNQ